MKPIAFTVPGNPVPQPRARISTYGGFARAYVPARHPVHAYRQAIASHAKAAGLRQTGDTLAIDIVAVFERPKSHMRKAGLKSDAPRLPRPDVDNIAKAVLDALQETFDDTNVMRLSVTKAFGSPAMTRVIIEGVACENTLFSSVLRMASAFCACFLGVFDCAKNESPPSRPRVIG